MKISGNAHLGQSETELIPHFLPALQKLWLACIQNGEWKRWQEQLKSMDIYVIHMYMHKDLHVYIIII